MTKFFLRNQLKVYFNYFQSKKLTKKLQLCGTYRSLINNAIRGVSTGHEKVLELNGVGFRANLKGEVLNYKLDSVMM